MESRSGGKVVEAGTGLPRRGDCVGIKDPATIHQEIWRSVVMNAPYGVVLLDFDGRVLFLNEAACQRLASRNIAPEKMLGEYFYTLVNPDDHEKVRENIERAVRDGIFSRHISRGIGPDLGIWYQGRIGPVKLKAETVAVCMIVRDITRQKAAEEVLKIAHEELEKRVEERTEALQKTNELLMREIEERKKMEGQLKIKSENLEEANTNLEEANTALKVLLNKRQEDQKELEEKVLSNVRGLVIPYLEKLKGMGLTKGQLAYVSILETSLNDIISPFSRNLSLAFQGLTSREIQVANLIRVDKSSKEIAEMMNLSVRTVEVHRDRVRKKLGLSNKRINLKACLQSMDGPR